MHSDIETYVRDRGLPSDDIHVLRSLFDRRRRGPVSDRESATFFDDRAAVGIRPTAPTRRYEDLGLLGTGGMGEVRRVRDLHLDRTLAMKVIRPDLLEKSSAIARFVEEAQIGAQLQHPGVPPVHEIGTLPDGRHYFTMMEIQGRPFAEQIRDAHVGGVTEVALRRLCDVFAKVCDAVAYAHSRGVVHRDLKPENVMLGAFGEVLVIDWGLAKVLGRENPFEGEGAILGTPAYMSPEQAAGGGSDVRSDVYALGATLYEVLTGNRPYNGRDAREVLAKVLAGPPEAPGRHLPAELIQVCEWAMSRDPAARLGDPSTLAATVRAWLEGAKKREKALEIVTSAEGMVEEAAALRDRSVRLRAEGDALLAPLKPWAEEAEKSAGWAMQDEAGRIERQAAVLELKREALLRGALTHAPDLHEAHAGLVALELARHRTAEADRDEARTSRAEVRLAEHADALPASHPLHHQVTAYLRGDGALTLHTDVPGAEVALYRYDQRNRRLVAVPERTLGLTPLREVPLAMGSYLCVLRHPDRAEVRYPVCIGRGEHWDPGRPVRLPRQGELGPDDCFVPAGFFRSGGDPDAVDGLPGSRQWCDDLVVKRFPVTNREYVAFLDDLVATSREAEALQHQPRERNAGEGTPVYGRDEAGRFLLRPDADGDLWDLDWPAMLLDWHAATAYAAWLAARTGRPWRLATGLEWEKAARGVDGRFFPWGDGFDPSWCCMRSSHAGHATPAVVDSYPVDESVYGVRGLGGNVEDWCADQTGAEGARLVCGGRWPGMARHARAASRNRFEPRQRSVDVGIRVVFSR